MDKKEFIKTSLKQIAEIDIDDLKAEQFLLYYNMITEKNKVMNLTAITDFEEFVIKHFADSISLVKVLDLNGNSKSHSLKLIDIGTGAGFPGIPLKIVFPELDVTLFDSLQKRLTFLDEVIGQLELKNIRTVHGRAEEFGRKLDYREKYDIVVSRAVAELTVLCELDLPFANIEGCFVAYKGAKGKEELEAAGRCIKLLGGKVQNVQEYKLGIKGEEQDRLLIRIDKVSATDKKYPRGSGKIFKAPLYMV